FRTVSEWLLQVHDWATAPSWIVPCTGVMPAIGAAIRAFSGPGDGVVIQPPVYPPFFRIVKDNDRVVVENPLINEDRYYRMDMDGLRRTLEDPANRILLLCSPHNPVGRVWRKEELDQVGRLCLETGTLLISDEIHADLVFDPERHIPSASISPDLACNIITCISPSKTFNIPGLQIAYSVIPDTDLREGFQASLRATATGTHNVFGLAASDAAYRFGASWRKTMLGYIRENRDRSIAFFREEMPWVGVRPPEGTYLLWLDMSASGLAPEDVTGKLIQKGRVVLDPGYWFGVQGSGWQRMNLACPRILLEEGLKRIRDSF
ncbi:MAG: PatB family C-S lyase, partial [Synergistales bacterium]|nr:PatB family C-S lyase [Synergistales bacterium]